ncbi:MAG: hypothetical protein IKP40_08880 [Clostridia bacterium]|nr:hypothetical protein [Clostridia bacterium]
MYGSPDENGRLDISSKEYAELQRLIALVDALENRTGRLEKRARLSRKGTWRDLCMFRRVARKVSDALCATLPARRQRLINAELKRTVCRIEVEPPNGLPAQKHEEYTTVPVTSLEWLVYRTLQWECLLCEKEGPEQRKCVFREKLDSLYPFEVTDLRKGECPWKTTTLLMDGGDE